jgi:hypothetical protein
MGISPFHAVDRTEFALVSLRLPHSGSFFTQLLDQASDSASNAITSRCQADAMALEQPPGRIKLHGLAAVGVENLS